MKKLKCHCGQFKAEINIDKLDKILRCNCSICKRKGAIMSMVKNEDFKVVEGEDKLSLYKFHTKVAEHFFCSNCGIYTHHIQRRDTTKIGINLGCLEDFDKLKLNDQKNLDGKNHPLDKK